jgi:hypothetical protein
MLTNSKYGNNKKLCGSFHHIAHISSHSLVYYYTHTTNEPVSDLENNPSFKLNIYYVFYGCMWFISPHSTQ